MIKWYNYVLGDKDMKHGFRSVAALACVVLLLIGTLSPITVALSGNVEGITNMVAAPEHELSVMSFNILDYVDDANYAKPKDRAPLAVKTILKYDPDLIGIQEAGDPQAANDNFDWNDYLVRELAKYGYGCRYLTQESVKPSTMTIGAGLMIFYKTERFDLIDHGSAQYKTSGQNGVQATFEGFTRVDNSRYYHWVKLWDKVQKTYLFQFNTHLAVPVGSLTQGGKTATADQRAMLANITRTISARQLADAMEKQAGDYPCFATGDYNASWSRSVKGNTNTSQLYELTKNDCFSAAASDANNRISVDPNGIIDHVFYNRYHADALTYRGVYEEHGGYQPSDHMAMVAYFNLTPPITFGSGSYDDDSRTLTDSTDEHTYTFDIKDLHEALNYEIYDADENKVTDTVTLKHTYNRFEIRLFNQTATNSKDNPYCTINATIHCSANLPVQITASSAENIYYTDGAWHIALKSSISSLTPICADGIFYADAACTRQQSFPISLNRATTLCYLRTNAGETFPVYIHRESATAESGKVLYVDDDIGSNTGTVAFAADETVLLVEGGVNAFGSLAAAAAKANTADGYTIYVAPGTYKGGAVSFSKNVTLLGNNHDVSPLVRADAGWSLSTDRKSESILDHQLNFTRSSVNFTVRGFTFVGNATNAYAINQSNSNITTTSVANIQKNIFRFSGNNTTNSSCIMFNTATKNSGIIADNYFEQVNEKANTLCRVLTTRNPYGILFEENYCVNFTDQISFLSAEVAHQNETDAGNFVMTFRYNRFDNCHPIQLYAAQCTDSRSLVDIEILYNDFVNCGNVNTDYAVKIYLANTNKFVTDYSKVSINIFGNRFIGCRRSIYLGHQANEGNIREATIHINRNRFIDMRQGLGTLMSLSFNVYSNEDVNATSENWDFSHNYYASDTVSGHEPEKFVTSLVTLNGNSVSAVDPALLHPYYTNPEMTWLSEGVIKTQTGITISNNTHNYDGLPHSLDIDAGEGAVISYSTDPAENRFYSMNKPTLTEPGNLYVYYQVEREGYVNFQGRALITVRVPNRSLKMEDMTIPYDGKVHALTPVYNAMEGDRVTYSYGGISFDTMPSFMDAGSYTVTVTVTNPYARDITATATLTITAGEITGVKMLVSDDIYVTGTEEGDILSYSVNGNNFTAQKPTLTGTERIVSLKVSRAGHNDLILSARPDTAPRPFDPTLTKTVTEGSILWSMSLVPDREMLLTENVTLLAYGLVTGESAEQILDGNGTFTPLKENETGILSLPADLTFTATTATPTAAYAVFVKDGTLYTVYSSIGTK